MSSTYRDSDSPESLADQEPWQDDGPEPSTTDSVDLHIRSSASSDIENGRLSMPVWMRESSKSFHWRWVPVPIRHFARSFATWSKGPDPPQIQKIIPVFPPIQELPLRLVDRFLPTRVHKAGGLAVLYSGWLLTFVLVLSHSATSGEIEGFGQPSPIWCGANFWYFNPSLKSALRLILSQVKGKWLRTRR